MMTWMKGVYQSKDIFRCRDIRDARSGDIWVPIESLTGRVFSWSRWLRPGPSSTHRSFEHSTGSHKCFPTIFRFSIFFRLVITFLNKDQV